VVVDAATGAPVPDASVRLGRGVSRATTTDREGHFAIPNPPVGAQLTLHVDEPRYAAYRDASILLRSDPAPPLFEVRLEPLPGVARLLVRCRDDAGALLSGVTVQLRREDGLACTRRTGATGELLVELAAGDYEVDVAPLRAGDMRDLGCEGAVLYAFGIRAGEQRVLDVTMRRMALLRGTIVGEASDAKIQLTRDPSPPRLPEEGGAPPPQELPGWAAPVISQRLLTRTVSVDADGRFAIQLPAGRADASVRTARGESAPQALQLTPGAVTEAVFVIEQPPLAVIGEVTDAGSGAPIEGAQVQGFRMTPVRTDAAGRFALGGDARVGSVRVSAEGYVAKSVTLPEGAPPVEIRVALRRGATLVVSAIDRDGAPVSRVGVLIRGEGAMTRRSANASGTCRFPGLAPGRYQVSSPDGRFPALEVELGEEDETRITVDVDP
jgi:hypothetical protein